MIDVEKLCRGCMCEMNPPQRICPICGYDNGQEEKRSEKCLPEHTILQGRYLLGRVLGEGGFGITYLALDLKEEQAVAIKEYFPVGLASRAGQHTGKKAKTVLVMAGEAGIHYKEGLQKFARESQTLARFRELPGIVTARDFFFENDTAYLVMEYVKGQSLKEYMVWYSQNNTKGDPMEYQVALALLEPVLHSLIEIHKAGIIHRDISPDNILVDDEAKVTLIDFGAARQEVRRNEMRSMTIMVKHGYAPEEQYRTHGEQGPWTDVYALCATLYHMISGRLPEESIERLYQDAVVPLKSLPLSVPVPEEISDVIEKGMAVRKGKRYQTAEALYTDLQNAWQAVRKRQEAERIRKRDEEEQRRQEEQRRREAGKKREEERNAAERRQKELLRAKRELEEKKRDEERRIIQEKERERRRKLEEKRRDEEKRIIQEQEKEAETRNKYLQNEIKRRWEILEIKGKWGASGVFILSVLVIFIYTFSTMKREQSVETAKLAESGTETEMITEVAEEVVTEVDTEAVIAEATEAVTEAAETSTYTELEREETEAETLRQLFVKESEAAEDKTAVDLPDTEEEYYQEAVKAQQAGDTAQAAIMFGKAGDYRDARDRSMELWSEVVVREDGIISVNPYRSSPSILAVKEDGTVCTTDEKYKGVEDWTDIVSVSAGAEHCLGLRADGTVVACGDNLFGEGDVSDWTDIVSISAGFCDSVGLKSDGTVVTCAGDTDMEEDVSVWKDIVAISVYYTDVVGLKTDGTVVTSGDGEDSRGISSWENLIGIASHSGKLVGIQMDGRLLFADEYDGEYMKEEFPENYKKMVRESFCSVSFDYFMYAGLKEDGTVIAMGLSEETQEIADSWENITAISAHENFLAAVTNEGKIVVANEDEERWSQVREWTDIVKMAEINMLDGGRGTVGLKVDGTLAVSGIGSWKDEAGQWEDIADIAAGTEFLLGLKRDGTVRCVSVFPAELDSISEWTDVIKISVCQDYAAGIKADGTAVVSGNCPFAVQLQTETWSNLKDIVVGEDMIAGIKSDGTVCVAVEESLEGEYDLSEWKDVVKIAVGDAEISGLQFTAIFGLQSEGSVLLALPGISDKIETSSVSDIAAGGSWFYLVLNGRVGRLDLDEPLEGDGRKTEFQDWDGIVSIMAGDNYVFGIREDGSVMASWEDENLIREAESWTGIRSLNTD